MTTKPQWTQAQAIDLARLIEDVCPKFGCHVALTGGLLYKDGPRKDADFLFYRIRQVEEINKLGLFDALEAIGITTKAGFGWCHKAEWRGQSIDFFFPDEDGEYPPTAQDDPDHQRELARENEWLSKQFADDPF